MTITRILPVAVLAAAVSAGAAPGQSGMRPYPPSEPPAGGVPSVLPATRGDPAASPRGYPGRGSYLPSVVPAGGAEPAGPGVTVPADPVARIAPGPGPTGLPPGAYPSPWFTDGPGCCGPLGRNGQVAYELHVDSGPAFVFGGTPFSDRLEVGWSFGGGGRTLFFNPAGDAAWTVDIGLNYTYNRGSPRDFLNVFVRQQPTTGAGGQQTFRPDVLTTSRIRGLHRTAFNFAVGRDWFVWGPGNPGAENGWNLRVGSEVGGQWGTAHTDVVPDNLPNSYTRRQKVFEGVFVGGRATVEAPLGGMVWFGGVNVQYGYQWMNIVPPQDGDIQYLNLLLTTGVRF